MGGLVTAVGRDKGDLPIISHSSSSRHIVRISTIPPELAAEVCGNALVGG